MQCALLRQLCYDGALRLFQNHIKLTVFFFPILVRGSAKEVMDWTIVKINESAQLLDVQSPCHNQKSLRSYYKNSQQLSLYLISTLYLISPHLVLIFRQGTESASSSLPLKMAMPLVTDNSCHHSQQKIDSLTITSNLASLMRWSSGMVQCCSWNYVKGRLFHSEGQHMHIIPSVSLQ